MNDTELAEFFRDDKNIDPLWAEMLEPGSEALSSVLSRERDEPTDTLEHLGPGDHPGTGTSQQAHAGNLFDQRFQDAAARLEGVMTTNPGGFSFNPITGKHPTTGFMVGIKKGPVFRVGDNREEMIEDVAEWVEAEYDTLDSGDDVYAGGWLNHDDNSYHLDISRNVSSESEATRLGNENDEISIWDIDNEQEIRL